MSESVISTRPENKPTLTKWYEVDSFEELPKNKVKDIYAVAFYGEQVVMVPHGEQNSSLPGGLVEPEETYQEALRRGVEKSTGTKIVSCLPLGYRANHVPGELGEETTYSLYTVAAVEPVSEMAIASNGNNSLAAEQVNQHLRHGEIGEWLVARAVDLRQHLQE